MPSNSGPVKMMYYQPPTLISMTNHLKRKDQLERGVEPAAGRRSLRTWTREKRKRKRRVPVLAMEVKTTTPATIGKALMPKQIKVEHVIDVNK